MSERSRLTRAEAAKVLGCCVGTVSKLFKGGVIEGVREGRSLFLFADSVEAYLRRLPRNTLVVVGYGEPDSEAMLEVVRYLMYTDRDGNPTPDAPAWYRPPSHRGRR